MFKNADTYPQPPRRVSIFPIPETDLQSPLQVLNRVLAELRKTEMSIQKIAFFEDPLVAIVDINDPKLPQAKPPWLQRFRRSKGTQMPNKRLKLNVTKAPDVQDLFFLKYETLARDVLVERLEGM